MSENKTLRKLSNCHFIFMFALLKLKCRNLLIYWWFITLWAKLLKRPKYCAQFFTFSGTSLSSKESRASVRLSTPGSLKWSALSRVFSRIDATTTLTSLTLHSNRQTLWRRQKDNQYRCRNDEQKERDRTGEATSGWIWRSEIMKW